MIPICDMHLPTEVEMTKIPGRTFFRGEPFGLYPKEDSFDDVYECKSCGRYYHQKLGYVHAPDQKNNRTTRRCYCDTEKNGQWMAVVSASDEDRVLLGCLICGTTVDPVPISEALSSH
jgi:hypothetical protein